MKFSPSSVVPEQMAATTPNMFVCDQYGKLPDIHGDGELTVNQAIRMSKLINKFVPAFSGMDNRIISGFRIEEVFVEGMDLKIRTSSGLGVIGKNVFKVPLKMEMTWTDFVRKVPSGVSSGKIALFFEYTDLVNEPVKNSSTGMFEGNPIPLPELIQKTANGDYDGLVSQSPEDTEENIRKKVIKLIASVNPNRPMPQNAWRTPTIRYPLDQYAYSPIKVTGFFYDPENQSLYDPDEWDETSDKILITSAINFVKTPSSVEVFFDKNDREPIYINGKKYIQQNCGYYSGSIGDIDGGVLDQDSYIPTEKKPSAIDVYLNMVVTRPHDAVILESVPSSLNEFYLFYNGKLMYPGTDYEIGPSGEILFTAAELTYGDKLYAFENLMDVESGCMRSRTRIVIPEGTKRIESSSLTPESIILPFYDGELVFQNNYVVESGSVKFVSTLEAGKCIDITECLFSSIGVLETIFSGSPSSSSPYVGIRGIKPENSYLVFYDGRFMMENADYKLQKNVISFMNGLILDVNNKLVVLRV